MDIAPLNQKTGYVRWMKSEGLPIHTGHGMADLRALEVAPYARMGGKAAFIQLHGMQGITGGYIGEIPPGDALKPERHLYEEVICILNGQGATELWDDHGNKKMLQWGKWSLFAPPMNTNHRLVNGSREPVRFLAVTNAPLAFDIYRDENFVFNCSLQFQRPLLWRRGLLRGRQEALRQRFDQYLGDQFHSRHQCGDVGKPRGEGCRSALGAVRDGRQRAGRPSGRVAGGQISQSAPPWSRRDYRWHPSRSVTCFSGTSNGVCIPIPTDNEGQVIDINWGEGSIYCPPPATGSTSTSTPVKNRRATWLCATAAAFILWVFKVSHRKTDDDVFRSVDEGGWMITYENEDPEIPKRYQAALKANGVVY